MAQQWAKGFYSSSAWLKARHVYLISVLDTPLGPCPPGVCERCFSFGKTVPATVVHHVVHLTPENIGDPRVTLNTDNLQRLCADCHAYVHSGADRPRVKFDENGEAIPFAESAREVIMRLTETADEKRNIHSSGGRR